MPIMQPSIFHWRLLSDENENNSYLQITKRKRWDDGMSAAFARRGLAERPILGLKCLKP